MIRQRQIDFRTEYRSRIRGWYDGYFHFLIIYAMGAAAFYIYVAHIHARHRARMADGAGDFFCSQFFEWAVHKTSCTPGHTKACAPIYERHTLNHHQFFTDDEMRFRDPKDWRVTLFPPYALVVFNPDVDPARGAARTWLTPNVGWLFMATTTGMYLVYESCISAVTSMRMRSCVIVPSSTRCAGTTPRTTTRG